MHIPDVYAIDSYQFATSVLGQTDASLSTPAPIFFKNAVNDGANKLGLSAPVIGIALDPTDHRLFVSDTINNRVLVYNLNASNVLTDYVPDNVLGQTNFWMNTALNTQAGMNVPNGIAFDDTHNRLFVTQGTSTTVARLTVYDVTEITDGENAVNVIGQSLFTAIAPATTQEGLQLATDVAYDSVNDRLFVAQPSGNRVTVYDVSSISDGEAATNVLGQAAFTTATAATTQTGMNVPYGLAYDSANQRLFVSEGTGNRVKVYDVAAITDNEDATYVLGQATFTATAAANTQAGMNAPRGLAYDSVNQRLYVTQTTSNRVTTYDVAAISNGENAVNVLGQSNFTNNAVNNTQAGMNAPNGVMLDQTGNRLYVLQSGSSRVSIFDVAAISDNENAVDLIGQYDDDLANPSPVYTKLAANNGANKLGFNAPQGVVLDATNHRLFVADSSNNRILVYNLSASNTPLDYIPDNVLGQLNFYSNALGTTQAGLNTPTGLTFDAATSRLFVSDFTNNRIVVYDTTSITNGQNAINVLGQINFTTLTAGVTQSGLYGPRQIAFDASTNQLYVADTTNNRALIFDVAVIEDGENAIYVLGQDDGLVGSPMPIFTKGVANNGPHKLGFNAPMTGIAMDSTDHRLFLSDSSNNRVLVYDLDTDNTLLDRVPDSVLGQLNFFTNPASRTQTHLNIPYGLAYDDANNRLFVANGGSNRVTAYDVTEITNGEPATYALGQVTFTAYAAASTQVGMNVPTDLVYDSANKRLFVSEVTGNRVKVYDLSPGVRDGLSADNALGQTTDSLTDPQPIYTKTTAHNGPHRLGLNAPVIGIVMDTVDHRLFISDTSNNRVLVYDLDANNALIDRIPDNVLGQLNYHTNTAVTSQTSIYAPNGLAYDSAGKRLFVVETSGNRVKVFDATTITDGMNAAYILGQISFAGATAATTQNGLNVPNDVAYDSVNNRLFVSQSTGNRVSVFNVATIANGENAVNVLGQAAFTTATAATTQTGMNVPYGLAYDSANQRLFVSEGTGNRVKVYDVAAITDNEDATYVLGQTNFTNTAAADSQGGMNAPRGLAYDATTSTLYVAETTGDRVKTYDVAAITNGENAVNVLGQANFTGATPANTQAGLNAPTGVYLDTAHNRLYVLQSGSHRVSVFDVETIVNNENAIDLLGQSDDDFVTPGPVYTKLLANNGPNKLGLNAPVIGIALDPTDHRLFVSDTGNNRVLVYNLDSNNLLVNRLPDNVLGQTNFYSNAAATTQIGMNVPNGIAFDDANNRLFVAQGTGNRVTVYDVTAITDGENAVSVFGQTTFTGTAAGNTQGGMNIPYDVIYDSVNSRLFVLQGTSNRVTTYDLSDGITDGENAVNVLGQANFTGTAAATTQAGMNAPRGLAYDSANQILYVSQATGNRVTTYDVTAITDGENAVNVLGQTTFTATTAGSTQAGMNDPRGISYDGTNHVLYVSQYTGNRITTYDVTAITDGENAVNVLGQYNFTTITASVMQNGLSGPTGVLADPANNRVYVLEATAHRLMTYNLLDGIATGMNASNMLGQTSWTAVTAGNTQAGMNGPRGLAYDGTNQILYVAQAGAHRVTTYDVTAITDGENAVNVLGQTNFTNAALGNTQAGMNDPRGLAFDDGTNKLYVSQLTGNRVTVYDVAAITDGENAINVLGQPTFTTIAAGTRQSGLNGPNGVFIDEANDLLYVPQSGAHRISIFNVASISNYEDAVDALGQFGNDINPPSPIFIKGTANNASYKLGLSAPQGIAVDATNHRLFVSDSTNNRILVYNMTAGNLPIDSIPDNVLGQTNFWWNAVGTTQWSLSSPTGLTFDAADNKLYAADYTNNRIMVYDTASITDGENAVAVLGQPAFTTATAGITQLGLSGPRQIHYDPSSKQLFVADATNSRLIIYKTTESSAAPGGGGGGKSFYFFGF